MCALSQRDFRDDSLDLHVHCTLFIDSGLYGQGTEFLGISEENSPVQVCGCLVQIQPVRGSIPGTPLPSSAGLKRRRREIKKSIARRLGNENENTAS